MPIRSVGLLQARVPICLSGRSCKAATPRSTPSRNSFIADGSCNCSPVLITIADDCLPRNQIPNHEIAFNIHNPQPGSPRPRRLRLPSRLQIESASPTHHPQQSSSLREALPILASDNSPGTMRMLFPGRASTVRQVGALSDFDNISVRIADVAARLAVLGDRLRDELRSSTFP
jgi:hypothetical protein